MYPTGMPQPFPCQLTLRSAGKNVPMHEHGAWLNAQGNGNTDVASGHYHRVRGFKVLPDPSDGHTHGLTTLPCGAGEPRNTGREGPMTGYGSDVSLVPMRGTLMAGAGGGMGIPKWVWVVGAVVVVGAIAAAVVMAKRAGDEE